MCVNHVSCHKLSLQLSSTAAINVQLFSSPSSPVSCVFYATLHVLQRCVLPLERRRQGSDDMSCENHSILHLERPFRFKRMWEKVRESEDRERVAGKAVGEVNQEKEEEVGGEKSTGDGQVWGATVRTLHTLVLLCSKSQLSILA